MTECTQSECARHYCFCAPPWNLRHRPKNRQSRNYPDSDATHRLFGGSAFGASGMFCSQRMSRYCAGLACFAMLVPLVLVVPCPMHVGGLAKWDPVTNCKCHDDDQQQLWNPGRHFQGIESGATVDFVVAVAPWVEHDEIPPCYCHLQGEPATLPAAGCLMSRSLEIVSTPSAAALRANHSFLFALIAGTEHSFRSARPHGSWFCRLQV